MRRMVLTGASLMVLAACSGSSGAVGEDSADSIKTTAVGNVVATIPSPTPTPETVDNGTAAIDLSANTAAVANDTGSGE